MNPAERRESLLEDGKKGMEELFPCRMEKLKEEWKQEGLREQMRGSFMELFHLWREREGERAVAGSLGICCLRSSIVMRQYRMLLVLCGEEFYLDSHVQESAWKPAGFFEGFEEDMEILCSGLKKKYPRLCRWEVESVRLFSVEYYYAAIGKLCKDWKEEIIKWAEESGLRMGERFFLYFGEYRGRGELLDEGKDDVK